MLKKEQMLCRWIKGDAYITWSVEERSPEEWHLNRPEERSQPWEEWGKHSKKKGQYMQRLCKGVGLSRHNIGAKKGPYGWSTVCNSERGWIVMWPVSFRPLQPKLRSLDFILWAMGRHDDHFRTPQRLNLWVEKANCQPWVKFNEVMCFQKA